MNKEGRWEPPERVKGNSNHGTEVFKDNNQKPKRYGEDALNKGLIGKKVKVSLLNNQTVEGIFFNIGMYDVSVTVRVQEKFGALVRENEKPIIILKSAIATVEVIG